MNQILVRSLRLRGTLLRAETTVRLLDGEIHPDLIADKLGPVILIHWRGRGAFDPREIAGELATETGATSVYYRIHSRKAQETAKAKAELVFGERRLEAVVSEGVLQAYIRPEDQVNAGIFVDMREIRAELAVISKNKRVLNLFSFTGLLGVAAALGGATEVIQVDVSKSILKWSKENATLNRCKQVKHISEDVQIYLKRLSRRGEKFDLIVADPPSFGRGKSSFKLPKDLSALVQQIKAILSPNGKALLSCNMTSVSPEDLARLVPGPTTKVQAPKIDFTAPLSKSPVMRGVWFTVDDRRDQ